MRQQNMRRLAKADYLKLLPILALAFYMAFIPHHGYPYPVHVDEWVHLAYSKAILQAGNATFVDPFLTQSTITLTSNLEAGFQVFWGVFHQISGISWLDIFKYFPSLIFMITVLAVYILARRQGFGWEAAFFTCLIPTTVGILGPGFLVPLAMGLPFIPLAIFAAFHYRTGWSYLTLFIFTCFLLSIHAATAVGLVIVLTPYILLNLKGNFKHSLGLTLAVTIPFLAFLPWISYILLLSAKSLFSQTTIPSYIDLPRIVEIYGYLPILFCLLGIPPLGIRSRKEDYGLILGLLALLIILVTFFTFHYGVELIYLRGLLYLMLMMSIIAGAGMMWVKNLGLPEKLISRLKVPFITQNVGNILCLALIIVTLLLCVPARQKIPYYHMIDDQDYEAFIWIKDGVNESYERAILDPWKATAFTAITGKKVWAKIHDYPKESAQKAYDFLGSGCSDTDFLKREGISIVYTRESCSNPDLVEVHKNVYLLKESESQ